jgi:signal transduction histidine kinase
MPKRKELFSDLSWKISGKALLPIMEQSRLPLAMVDKTGRFSFINDTALRMLGSPGRSFSQQFNAFTLPSFKQVGLDQAIRKAFRGKTIFTELAYTSMFGKKIDGTIQCFPMAEEGKNIECVLIVIFVNSDGDRVDGGEDIETLRQELETAHVELREMNQLQQRFIAMVSHELRTPLMPLLGYLVMLKEQKLGTLNVKQQKGVKIATRSARRLLDLVEKVLAMTRGRKEIQAIKLAPLDPCSLLDEAAESMAPLMEKKHLQVTVDCTPGLPSVLGDRRKLVQVLLTLLDNAQKFSEPGGKVLLSADRRAVQAENDRQPMLTIVVANTGIRIPPAERSRVFEVFYQAEPLETRVTSGMGLGLSIAREVILAHGGTIRVAERQGYDTAIHIELPLADPTKGHLRGRDSSSARARHNSGDAGAESFKLDYRILLADPDPAHRQTIAAVAENISANVKTCDSAATGERLLEDWPPTVLILSLEDPGTLALIDQIRQHGPRRLLPIVVLAEPHAMSQRRLALDTGATAVLAADSIDPSLTTILRCIYPSCF